MNLQVRETGHRVLPGVRATRSRVELWCESEGTWDEDYLEDTWEQREDEKRVPGETAIDVNIYIKLYSTLLMMIIITMMVVLQQ